MQVLDIDKEHSVETMLGAVTGLSSVLEHIIKKGEIDTRDENSIESCIEQLYSSIEYLWIQTGISLPTEVDQEKLMQNLRDYAANLKVQKTQGK